MGAMRSLSSVGVMITAMVFVTAAWASPPGNDYKLIFADEFGGSEIDDIKWATKYQWGRTHNHQAYMRDGNVTVEDGRVKLTATREQTFGKQFSSGVISTHNTFRLDKGYIEMRIKMPSKRGSWPAFWMLKSGWPPEIDIMEYPLFTGNNKQDEYYVNSHWGSAGNPSSNGSWIDRNVDLGNAFHTYGLEWTGSQLKYYFDGNLVKTASNQSSFENMYLIFNYAVGGWPGTPGQNKWADGESDVTQANWLRVWEKKSSLPNTRWTKNDAAWGSWGTDENWTNNAPKYERQDVYLPTLDGRGEMEVRWSGAKTVGDIRFTGDTAYTLGGAGVTDASVMFADRSDGWAWLSVDGGAGGHVINSRVEAWNNLVINNEGAQPLTINGDVIDQLHTNTNGNLAGGHVSIKGDSGILLNGDGYWRRDTRIEGGKLVVNGKLYQSGGNPLGAGDMALEIKQGGSITLGDLNHGGALGNLPTDSGRITFDNGTLILRGATNTTRGFTIKAGGATINASLFSSVVFNDDGNPDHQVVSEAGGDLTLTGFESAEFNKPIGGTGGLTVSTLSSWQIGATNTYAGETVVAAGTLNLTGSTGHGDTTVQSGGTLTGGGDVRGSLLVESGGAVRPGGDRSGGGPFSPAFTYTMTVSGDYTQQAGATMHATFNEHTLNVGGEATLAGGLNLQQGEPLALGATWTLLSADVIHGGFDADAISGAAIDATTAIAVLYVDGGDADTLADRVQLMATFKGDANGDGTVSLADLDAVGIGFGNAGAWQAGDFNYDGEVGLVDLDALGVNFGQAVPVAAAQHAMPAMPEPASLMLLGLGGLALMRRG